MPHKTFILADEVLKSDQYSECVIRMAKEIQDINITRRRRIAKLWTVYRVAYKKYATEIKRVPYNLRAKKSREILAGVLPANLHNDFHVCKNELANSIIRVLFHEFEACVQASYCEDVQLMHKYMVCVNAERFDDSLSAVSFLRRIHRTRLTEIVLFRLMREAS